MDLFTLPGAIFWIKRPLHLSTLCFQLTRAEDKQRDFPKEKEASFILPPFPTRVVRSLGKKEIKKEETD
jgi:hypothetical protein